MNGAISPFYKTAIQDINQWITKLRANVPAQLIKILQQMIMTTEAAPSGWGSTLERELEMIAIVHGTWNKRQVKLSSNSREIKAITQGLRSFAKILKNLRVQSLAIRSDNSTLNNRKAKNLDPDYSPPMNQKRDIRSTKKITIKNLKKFATQGINQTWKKKLSWIHPPIPLLPVNLKKIREEQIEAMIIAPLWPGQIQYTEPVNENAQSLMLGWSNEILEPGTSLIKKNLKLPPGKICCFLMDRRPRREEYSQERF
ncbi:MAG: hypothetical protein EZS28_041414 [Streblomastix strix]|uniref:Uncharacterized protein n=1 Tax=Streblomastix strix TaxID=222440 RepID=A0A5J4TYQ1_9EUKA|nr:MAG: hypothetical protein EZS28_041414 [Streblomastix strix]